MKRQSVLMAVILQLGVAGASFAQNCEEGAETAAQVRNCIAAQNEALVDSVFAETLKRVRANNPAAVPKLQLAQKSWLTFAQDSCQYTIAVIEATTNSNDAELMCMQTFSEARIRVLKAYQRELEQNR